VEGDYALQQVGAGAVVQDDLFEGQDQAAGIPDNTAHGERVHGVMPWDGHDAPAVGHDDVLALPRNLETGLLKRPNSPKVGYPAYLGHALRGDLHFPQVLPACQLLGNFEVFADRILDVGQSLLLRGALRPAPGQTGARDAVPLFGSHQSNWVLHTSNFSMTSGREWPRMNADEHGQRTGEFLRQVNGGAVCGKSVVSGQQNEFLDLRLCDEHAIKRIAVAPGKQGDRPGVRGRQWQPLEGFGGQPLGEVIRQA